jgi:ABC-type multidrug transport system ATPase subunit
MVCDRVAIIVKGRIRFEGEVGDVVRGSEEEVDVVVANLAAEAALEISEQFDARLRGVGDRIELRFAAKQTDEALLMALESGGRIVSVSPHRVSLESLFLSAVEAGASEENL